MLKKRTQASPSDVPASGNVKQHAGQHQQAAGKDDRHHASLVDTQGQVLPRAAVHTPTAHVLCTLRRYAALPQRDKHDPDDHGNKQCRQNQQRFDADTSRSDSDQFKLGLIHQQIDQSTWHAGENPCHDQQTDSVADPELVNLLTDPHQKHRAAGHGQDGGQLPAEPNGARSALRNASAIRFPPSVDSRIKKNLT